MQQLPLAAVLFFLIKFLFQLRDNFNGWYTYIGPLKFHFPKHTNFNAIIAVIVLAKELTIIIELYEALFSSDPENFFAIFICCFIKIINCFFGFLLSIDFHNPQTQK